MITSGNVENRRSKDYPNKSLLLNKHHIASKGVGSLTEKIASTKCQI
jgi:hypothetical protein